MAGMFELFIDEDACFRFRLKAADGTVVAVSRSFPDKPAVVSGIGLVRECAGMGLITDLCPEVSHRRSPAAPPAPGVRQVRSAAPQRAVGAGPHRPAGPRLAPVRRGLPSVA
ncbi:YegP family protein [Arthrobacter sp. MA-N2]|uniref:YegP family protein n=1 Tax=Arthrobacter sp. MA-N2 TaxID=1101188 RepID=UPI0004AEED24|nr:DUF1508 domain-containing protein [Arthrobacter sp. MA-N2]